MAAWYSSRGLHDQAGLADTGLTGNAQDGGVGRVQEAVERTHVPVAPNEDRADEGRGENVPALAHGGAGGSSPGRGDDLDLVAVRVVQVESAEWQKRVLAPTDWVAKVGQAPPLRLPIARFNFQAKVVHVAIELTGRRGSNVWRPRDQDDLLGNSVCRRANAQKRRGRPIGRDNRQAELISVERHGPLKVGYQKDDFG